MRVIATTFVLVASLAGFGCVASAPGRPAPDDARADPGRRLTIAVSPFANLSGDRGHEYFGFSVSEFLSGALAGFEGVTVVERQQLAALLEEQELQLSGLTERADAAKAGAILNAQQIIVGSYVVISGRYELSGRVVDVQSGGVLSSATASVPVDGSARASLIGFAASLISGIDGYRSSIPALAAIESAAAYDEAGQRDWAKALAALYSDDTEGASRYLLSVLSRGGAPNPAYAEAREAYFDLGGGSGGQALFNQLLERQTSHNARLVEHAKALNLYRSIVRQTLNQAAGLIGPDSFALEVASEERIELGDVSATVALPSGVGIGLRPDIEAELKRLLAEQDIVGLDQGGLRLLKAPPSGPLLSDLALQGLFEPSLEAKLRYLVDFVSVDGTPLYSVRSASQRPLALRRGLALLSSPSLERYDEQEPSAGFMLLADGRVSVQARELRRLSGIRVSLDPNSLSVKAAMPVLDEVAWSSLLTHAYRKAYRRLVGIGDDSSPIKDVVISDAFFTTHDDALGPAPILRQDGRYASWAKLTAAVYYGDAAGDVVSATWSRGALRASGGSVGGKLGADAVVYFDAPTALLTDPKYANEPLVVSIAGAGSSGVATVRLYERLVWESVDSGASFGFGTAFTMTEKVDRIYSSGGAAFEAATGMKIWPTAVRDGRSAVRIFGSKVLAAGGRIIIVDEPRTRFVALRESDGNPLWEYVGGAYGPKSSYDRNSDFELRGLGADARRVYWASNRWLVAVDANTGKELWARSILAYNLQRLTAYGGVIVIVSRSSRGDTIVTRFDAATGTPLDDRACLAIDHDAGIMFVRTETNAMNRLLGGSDELLAIDIASGRLLWSRRIRWPEWVNMSIQDGTAFYSGQASDFMMGSFDTRSGKQYMERNVRSARYLRVAWVIGMRIGLDDAREYDLMSGQELAAKASERDGPALVVTRAPGQKDLDIGSWAHEPSYSRLKNNAWSSTAFLGELDASAAKLAVDGLYSGLTGLAMMRFLAEQEGGVLIGGGAFVTAGPRSLRAFDLSFGAR